MQSILWVELDPIMRLDRIYLYALGQRLYLLDNRSAFATLASLVLLCIPSEHIWKRYWHKSSLRMKKLVFCLIMLCFLQSSAEGGGSSPLCEHIQEILSDILRTERP